ncbi:MAG: methyltransferase [Faecalibacterium sp.]
MSMPWKCPHCGKKLKPKREGGLYCLKNHQFDTAKEGYFYLLPVQNRKTKLPGDSKEMITARRVFLNAGYYQIFGDALGALCLEYGIPLAQQMQNGKKRKAAAPVQSGCETAPLHLLDTGCGEGWYDRAIAAAFAEAEKPLALAGFDIAKDAVRLAAKALPSAQYAVGSSFAQPVQTEWADVLINVFSPLALEEFHRVLRADGIFIYAVPSARHLFGMKEVLYETPYENPVQQPDYAGFTLLERRSVTGQITLPKEMLSSLFAMTPYYWKTPRDGAERLMAQESLTTEISFDFLVFQKSELPQAE